METPNFQTGIYRWRQGKGVKTQEFGCYHFILSFCAKLLFPSFSPSSFSCMHSNLTKCNFQTSQEDLAAVQLDNKTLFFHLQESNLCPLPSVQVSNHCWTCFTVNQVFEQPTLVRINCKAYPWMHSATWWDAPAVVKLVSGSRCVYSQQVRLFNLRSSKAEIIFCLLKVNC